MIRQLAWFAVAMSLAFGMTGCGSKEKEELRQKVANYEQQLAKANSQVAEQQSAIASLEKSLEDAHADVAKCKAERDKLKSELRGKTRKSAPKAKKK